MRTPKVFGKLANKAETRGRRSKLLEPPKEPPRKKSHWDHVLEEMAWLAKDFESERKWKLSHARRVALRVIKSGLDQSSIGGIRLREEEQRTKRLASNISKEVRKFWIKIEKLVNHKHQRDLQERMKKARDKQLDFLLGQTERYSTMLAENLVDLPLPQVQNSEPPQSSSLKHSNEDHEEVKVIETKTTGFPSDSASEFPLQNFETKDVVNPCFQAKKGIVADSDDEFSGGSIEDVEDDEATLEADEALISKDERKEELDALQDEADLPLDEILKRYGPRDGSSEVEHEEKSDEDDKDAEDDKDTEEHIFQIDKEVPNQSEGDSQVNESVADKEISEHIPKSSSLEEDSGVKSILSNGVLRGEHNAYVESIKNVFSDSGMVLIEENTDAVVNLHVDLTGQLSENDNFVNASANGKKNNESIRMKEAHGHSSESSQGIEESNKYLLQSDAESDDGEYANAVLAEEDEDDEDTLLEEEELAKAEGDDTAREIDALKAESELPIELLLEKYRQNECLDVEDQEGTTGEVPEEVDVEKLHTRDESTTQDMQIVSSVAEEKKGATTSELNQMPKGTCKLQEIEEDDSSDVKIADAAAAARLAQPTGNTFSTTKVRTKLPFLLKHPLREYQHIGLDWLVTMYEKRLNGILADEMGLGKTIMTIALLAHLACEKGIWGPHLIVVPTSVMLNWETEFMKWCPAFKVLTYFGSAKERKMKRQGWAKQNSFHVCITTYRLVIQDAKAFKRKKWKYLILDEAHLIKNWKSQRWQTLLNFNSKRRILLTGTPLQNDLMELWSLMHFLMPHLFQSQQEFKDWFCNPISGMVERQEQVNKEVVDRLHNVLRPFILRRLKRDVEKQLPKKYEHVVSCKLSKRQRSLYEDFIANNETQATLASGNFLGLINVLMQLRKVCNHPDLFEGRPIISSFDMMGLENRVNSSVCSVYNKAPLECLDLVGMNLVFTHLDFAMNSWEHEEVARISTPASLIQEIHAIQRQESMHSSGRNIFEEIQQYLHEEKVKQARERAAARAWINSLRCKQKPLYGSNLRKSVTVEHPVFDIHKKIGNPSRFLETSSLLAELVLTPSQRCQKMLDLIESFVFAIPAARAPQPLLWCTKTESAVLLPPPVEGNTAKEISSLLEPLRPVIVRRQLFFPDRRLIQFDCGKLQELAILLRRLKSEGHKALIFTQMTRMLDVLEAFINIYGYTYVRLDGSTQPEQRQILMQRFNTNPKIFLFILSTRSGGVGINLVGADTVIFYDSDWNPAMDQQAQDRCHRIGQTREVHIYRLVSEKTIEENILKKANQKRALDDLVIQSGGYNTEFFKKLDPMDLFSGLQGVKTPKTALGSSDSVSQGDHYMLSNADVEAALKNVEDEADYMALKKVELEDADHDQEFNEDVVTKLMEEEDYGNDLEETKTDFKRAQEQELMDNKIDEIHATDVEWEMNPRSGSQAVDSELDMTVDIQQQMNASTGADYLPFEDRLLPIEKYAMRFLEQWDPIVDKAAIDSQVKIEEAEWELDRLEKLKEEQEAEIDEDDEPLVYETWDTEYANETYRQQVEVLAQQQLLQDQLEWDSEGACLDGDIEDKRRQKTKLKKKMKKTKFKSLKKGNLASSEDNEKMETENDSFEIVGHHESGLLQRKRKALRMFDDDTPPRHQIKKLKKQHTNSDGYSQPMDVDEFLDDNSQDATWNMNKGGKFSIISVPSKKFSIIKLDNKKRKSVRKSRDGLHSFEKWSTSEDAVLCAIVHEYGINWDLVSSTLYAITGGGFYRGRYRNPVDCRERFGELFLNIISSSSADINREKSNSCAKTQLKVTEDHFKKLLDVVQELPDNDLLLQRHFAAVLSAVSQHKNAGTQKAGQNNFLSKRSSFSNSVNEDQRHLSTFSGSRARELIEAALNDSSKDEGNFSSKGAMSVYQQVLLGISSRQDQRTASPSENLALNLEFPDATNADESIPLKEVTVIVNGSELQPDSVEISNNIVLELAYRHPNVLNRNPEVITKRDTSWEDFRCANLTGSLTLPKIHVPEKQLHATELARPVHKRPRLLDLNQRISETDETDDATLDSATLDSDLDEAEPTFIVERSALMSELRELMSEEFEHLDSLDPDYDYNFLDFTTVNDSSVSLHLTESETDNWDEEISEDLNELEILLANWIL